MRILPALSALGAAAAALPADAATLNVATDESSRYVTEDGIASYTSNGASLAGATVTATFADGSSESAVITAYGRNTGAIYGTLFELVETGTSYSNPFALYNASDSALVSLAIDLATASSVFDLDYGGEIGTEGSNLGRTAVEASSSGSEDGTSLTGVVEATYSGLVNVAGSDPVGDLYTSLLIDLSGTTDGGLASGSDWYFIADTDQLATEGDLAPVAPVPLPAGLLPLAAALSGLALLHRRKARGTAL